MTVERSGQMGIALKRENSGGEPSMLKRRTSFSIDEQEHPKQTAERQESIATEFQARNSSTVIKDTIPESAIETPQSESDKRLGGGDQKKQTTKPSKVEEKKTTAGPSNGHTNGSAKPAAVKSADMPTTAKTISRPAAISTAKTTTTAKVSPKKIKTPAPKTPTTPVRTQVKEAPAKSPDKKPEKKTGKQPEKKPSRASLASSGTSKPASKPTTTPTQGSAPKTRIQPSPPQTGFVKPRPKSPTRPIKLPASLTAHTASSGSKTATAPPRTSSRQSLSRASGNIQPTNSLQAHHAVSRSPSRASTTGKSTLTRKPSTLKPGHSRPSLGPPPAALKKQTSRQSLPQAAPADEGFLARMMRPTTSSASKTIVEKAAPLTPPKRSQSVKRPSTKDGPSKVVTPLASPAAKAPKQLAPKAMPKVVNATASSSQDAPVKEEEEPKAVESVPAAKEEVAEAPVETAPAEITESVEEPQVDVEETKATEPEVSHVEEPVVVEEEPAPVEDEPVVAPSVPDVEAPITPKVTEEENHEVGAAKELEVEKEVPEAEAEPERVESEPIVEQKASVPAKVEELEDPADREAREEIERLNAEVMAASKDTD